MSVGVPVSQAYRQVRDGLLRMHRYSLEGRFESEEADALRDAMDEPWEQLTAPEKSRFLGLSRDLNSIGDPADLDDPDCLAADGAMRLSAADEAMRRGELDGALEILRDIAPANPPGVVFYTRGVIWSHIGDEEVAALFFAHAVKLARRAVREPSPA